MDHRDFSFTEGAWLLPMEKLSLKANVPNNIRKLFASELISIVYSNELLLFDFDNNHKIRSL